MTRTHVVLEIPLGGAASEGIEERIHGALADVAGVILVSVASAAFRVRIVHEQSDDVRANIVKALQPLRISAALPDVHGTSNHAPWGVRPPGEDAV